jgi:hypothetical protein
LDGNGDGSQTATPSIRRNPRHPRNAALWLDRCGGDEAISERQFDLVAGERAG